MMIDRQKPTPEQLAEAKAKLRAMLSKADAPAEPDAGYGFTNAPAVQPEPEPEPIADATPEAVMARRRRWAQEDAAVYEGTEEEQAEPVQDAPPPLNENGEINLEEWVEVRRRETRPLLSAGTVFHVLTGKVTSYWRKRRPSDGNEAVIEEYPAAPEDAKDTNSDTFSQWANKVIDGQSNTFPLYRKAFHERFGAIEDRGEEPFHRRNMGFSGWGTHR
jgi:hypothetical protein